MPILLWHFYFTVVRIWNCTIHRNRRLYLLFADKHKKVSRYTSRAWPLSILYNTALNEYLLWMIRKAWTMPWRFILLYLTFPATNVWNVMRDEVLSDTTTCAVSSIIASRVIANFICILFEIRDIEKDRAKYSIKKQLQMSDWTYRLSGNSMPRFWLTFQSKNHQCSLHIIFVRI